MEPKPVSASRVVMSQLMQPSDGNPLGNVHGGVIMKLVDEAGATAAIRHCRRPVVTAAIDGMSFLSPVYIGNLLILKASVNLVGTTSLEVGVRVEAEHLLTGKVTHVASAHIVYVAIDREGRPVPVPPLISETEEDRRRMEAARKRRQRHLELRAEQGGATPGGKA